MAWVDVTKAYDLVDHTWLAEVMRIHRFPKWLCGTISHLAASWDTKIVAVTKQGPEISRSIRFIKRLPSPPLYLMPKPSSLATRCHRGM